MSHPKVVLLILRIALTSVFLYAAIAATLQPSNWIGYLPQFLHQFASPTLLLGGFSLFQVILSIWIVTGWKSSIAAALAAATILGIIAANITQLDILFRDFAIFFTAVALYVGSLENSKKK